MRYIDISKIEYMLDPKQKDALETATNEVKKVYLETEADLARDPSDKQKKEAEEKRSDIIKKHSGIWSDLKTLYENYSYKKCWYTESINPGSHKDIDHFRPKGEVYENELHPGYWWLAFDWENYRYSCQFANQLKKNPETNVTGGKGTHFPLLNEDTRVFSPDKDHRTEDNMLLDPCNASDCKLLSFHINGKPIVHPKFEDDNNAKKRIETSIKYMNIDYPTFNEEREMLYQEIKKLVKEANNAYKRLAQNQKDNSADRITFDNRIADLVNKQDDKSPYSRAAHEFIRSFREYEWVDKYLIN